MARLDQRFFNRKTEAVARELLGKVLVRKIGKDKISGKIVETEAYIGSHDLACHASRGKTERTSAMFKKAGIWYVYMIYGFYHCLNIVTEEKDHPSAVLIRALEPLEGIGKMKKNRKTDEILNLASGPGKLCQALEIDRGMNCTSAISKGAKLYIEDRKIEIPKSKIKKTKRIGVDYAGKWKDRHLRFYIKNNPFVSKI
ncbi:MAG: DNA-3-methyladenine glycosylase [Candidatus Moranbacteria bacterium]|jgi:DNA-3-methyladenine glycosylase|nr:DNA-3-methyladenine glycosylase [Candidatus Moranbacteria bacterium]MDD5652325.1 DNA-3-methyladenine glycosylase [Candidatus Moranbacteria bacterium]MDX9855969.1 DNA-3-methyladenine glycosylase [Candidatus Moranbacteria bacterium]